MHAGNELAQVLGRFGRVIQQAIDRIAQGVAAHGNGLDNNFRHTVRRNGTLRSQQGRRRRPFVRVGRRAGRS